MTDAQPTRSRPPLRLAIAAIVAAPVALLLDAFSIIFTVWIPPLRPLITVLLTPATLLHPVLASIAFPNVASIAVIIVVEAFYLWLVFMAAWWLLFRRSGDPSV